MNSNGMKTKTKTTCTQPLDPIGEDSELLIINTKAPIFVDISEGFYKHRVQRERNFPPIERFVHDMKRDDQEE